MALFKVERGSSEDLMVKRPTIKDGFAYFTPDDGKFYIDVGTDGDPAVIGDHLDEESGANRIMISGSGDEEVAVTFEPDDPIPDADAFKIWINQAGSEVLTAYNVTYDETNVGDKLHALDDDIDNIIPNSGGLGELQDYIIEIGTLNNGGAGWNQVTYKRRFEVGAPTVTVNVIGEYLIFIRNLTQSGFQYEIKTLSGENTDDTNITFNYQAIEYGGE